MYLEIIMACPHLKTPLRTRVISTCQKRRQLELFGLALIFNEQRHGLELLHVDQSLVGQFE